MKHIFSVLVSGSRYILCREAFHKRKTTGFIMGSWFSSKKASAPGMEKETANNKKLTDSEWKQKLSNEEYYVCRQKGTEQPFSGAYYNNKDKGIYNCVCCGVELFRSDEKFDTGCGWPSFSQAAGAEGRDETDSNIKQKQDTSHGMNRTEVMCKQCDSHLGHVFDDGPHPTGLRYCVNSVSLKFKPQSQV